MDSVITLNLRGTKKQYYKNLLVKCPYFSCLLGNSSFKPTCPDNKDGSYFVDCDVDFFENIISFLEIGETKEINKYSTAYVLNQFGKFGIQFDTEYYRNKARNKTISEIKDFFETVLLYLNEKNKDITLQFLFAQTGETKYQFDSDTNTLTCVWNSETNYKLSTLKCHETFQYEWNQHMTEKVIVTKIKYIQKFLIQLIKS